MEDKVRSENIPYFDINVVDIDIDVDILTLLCIFIIFLMLGILYHAPNVTLIVRIKIKIL